MLALCTGKWCSGDEDREACGGVGSCDYATGQCQCPDTYEVLHRRLHATTPAQQNPYILASSVAIVTPANPQRYRKKSAVTITPRFLSCMVSPLHNPRGLRKTHKVSSTARAEYSSHLLALHAPANESTHNSSTHLQNGLPPRRGEAHAQFPHIQRIHAEYMQNTGAKHALRISGA